MRKFRLCKNCLKTHKPPCEFKSACNKDNCTGVHHELLHREWNNEGGSKKEDESEKNQQTTESVASHQGSNTTSLFKIVAVVLHSEIIQCWMQ